jgi:HEAT repeat protein
VEVIFVLTGDNLLCSRTLLFGLALFWGPCQLGCARQAVPVASEKKSAALSIAALVDQLKLDDRQARLEALGQLRKLGPRAKEAVPTLTKVLDDKDPSVRAGAAVALGCIGADAKPAVSALLSKLKDADKNVRVASATALAGIGVRDNRTLSALSEALKEPDATLRVVIAEALAQLDLQSQDAVTTVTQVLLTDGDPGNRAWAALSLKGMKSARMKAAVPALISALKDPDAHVRESAAEALGSICEQAREVVPALIERLHQDSEASVRIQAAQALGEFGPEAKTAIPALTRALKDRDSDVRTLAAQSLNQIQTWQKKRGRNGMEKQAEQMKKKS